MINSQWKKLLAEEKAYKESVMRDHEFSNASFIRAHNR